MIEQNIETTTIEQLKAALQDADLFDGIQIIGAWQTDEVVKALEETDAESILGVKATPRSYDTPLIPYAAIDVNISFSTRAEIDFDGDKWKAICGVIADKLQEWQNDFSKIKIFDIENKSQTEGFQQNGGDVGPDADKKIWTYQQSFTLYVVLIQDEVPDSDYFVLMPVWEYAYKKDATAGWYKTKLRVAENPDPEVFLSKYALAAEDDPTYVYAGIDENGQVESFYDPDAIYKYFYPNELSTLTDAQKTAAKIIKYQPKDGLPTEEILEAIKEGQAVVDDLEADNKALVIDDNCKRVPTERWKFNTRPVWIHLPECEYYGDLTTSETSSSTFNATIARANDMGDIATYYNNTHLEQVDLPNLVDFTTYQNNPLYGGDDSVSRLAYRNYYMPRTFYNNRKLERVDIGNCTTIPYRTFYECSSLKEVKTNKPIDKVCSAGFWNCTNLEDANLASTVTLFNYQNVNPDSAGTNSSSYSTGYFRFCYKLKFPENFKIAMAGKEHGWGLVYEDFYNANELDDLDFETTENDITLGDRALYGTKLTKFTGSSKVSTIRGANALSFTQGTYYDFPNLTSMTGTSPFQRNNNQPTMDLKFSEGLSSGSCNMTTNWNFANKIRYMAPVNITGISTYIAYPNTAAPLKVLDFTGRRTDLGVPSLNAQQSLWPSQVGTKRCKIIIPDELYDEWITTTNWAAAYATKPELFVKSSEWDGNIDWR